MIILLLVNRINARIKVIIKVISFFPIRNITKLIEKYLFQEKDSFVDSSLANDRYNICINWISVNNEYISHYNNLLQNYQDHQYCQNFQGIKFEHEPWNLGLTYSHHASLGDTSSKSTGSFNPTWVFRSEGDFHVSCAVHVALEVVQDRCQ